ncbi:MAG: helix-turn-helix domain-containing protein [Ruminococcaceae bacterium]|nr:helix-turn-helix domain-containing protein [Oscillospiraceae bacterium]
MNKKSTPKFDFPHTHLMVFNDLFGKYGITCKKTKYQKRFFPMHNHNYIEFEYVTNGEMTEKLNGSINNMAKGSFHCLDQYDSHCFTTERFFEFNNISIDIKKIPPHIINLLRLKPFPYVGKFDSSSLLKINELFDTIYELQNSNVPFAEETIYSYLTLFIIEFLKAGETINCETQNPSYGYIKSAVKYIEKNFQNPITLTEVANYLNIAPTYLSQLFPKFLGCGFTQYLNSYRISIAKELILSSNLSITEIALNSGFGSLCSFSRAFNKYVGCSANVFKKNYKIK